MKWFFLGLLGVIVVAVNGDTGVVGQASLSIGTFIDTEVCYSAIAGSVANKDEDKRMDPESYIGFVNLYGPDNLLDSPITFEELPLILVNNFYFLACLCGSETEPECCVGSNAGIETIGALPGDTPTDDEKSYLYVVCAQTSLAIDRVIQSLAPSTAPVPAESVIPTAAPVAPSAAPVSGPPVNPNEEVVQLKYNIAVKNETAVFSDYDDELISAMNSMTPTLLSEVRRRQLRAGRKLQTVSLPTVITDNEVIDCPENLIEPAARCESITAYAILLFQPTDEEPNRRAKDFEEVASDAIMNGDLQEFLESSTIFIIDKNALDDGGTPRGNNRAGIAAGAIIAVMVFATIAYFVSGKRRQGDDEVGDLPVSDLKLDQGADDQSANDGGDASSSNAGSSGWSSSAGIDSMNTGSADGLDLAAVAHPPVPKKSVTSDVVEEDDMNTPKVTRDDLDSAIEAGDWAAVGATAALLAAASDSQSYSSKSEQYTGTRSRSGSSVSSLDVARAAELDHLVDAGDWEGVVLAAAKYEGDDSKESHSASISGSDTRSDTAGQTADSSIASSRGLKQQEYRAIVEDLVQRVVPEEIQNVDEMMLQFRGREDELVETLRTMQERAVAQKARSSSQTAAKREAKSSVIAKSKTDQPITPRSSKTIGTGQVSAAIAKSKSLGTGEIRSSSGKKEAASAKKKSKTDQNALDAAIEAGDWEAVGDEAALLTDSNSLTSADTDEINKFADGVSTDGSSAVGSKNLADVADELEELIEAGDWTGVVQAASSSKATGVDTKPESKEARKLRRLKHLQEEQEALAQAEIWTAIAEQSKQETDSTDQGAAEAANWAISRSLNALVEAELSGINDQSTVGTDGDSLYQQGGSRTVKDQEGDESEKEV